MPYYAGMVVRIHFGDMRESAMTKSLEFLIEAARRASPSPEQQEEQRRSFAYGNTAFENSLITREMVDEQAEAIARERANQRRE
jgi:hypothetical protein